MMRKATFWGVAAALLWTGFALLAAWADGVSLLVTAVAIVVPVALIGALIWLVALQARAPDRPEAAPLDTAALETALTKMMERQKVTDRALHSLLKGREADRNLLTEVAHNTARGSGAPRSAAVVEVEAVPAQPNLPLEAPHFDVVSGAPALPDILRALNFPTDADDIAGFRAMRRAMGDRVIAQILRAAEDVLNLLAQDGIYTDDMEPSETAPALWRKFAEGARGDEMAPLAGITDASAITLTRARLRSDDVFRDAALHFMRRFDLMLRDRVDGWSDSEIERLIDTRSGRAFMLIAAVTGTFD